MSPIRMAQILLTLTALEFFGPILRDINATHALNPEWVGHARLHLIWLLAFMGFSGIANLWLRGRHVSAVLNAVAFAVALVLLARDFRRPRE